MANVYRLLQRQLLGHKEERKGPTILCIQSVMSTTVYFILHCMFKKKKIKLKLSCCFFSAFQMWTSYVPATSEFPMIPINISDSDGAYNVLDWQRVATRIMFSHFFRLRQVLGAVVSQCRYLQIPIGNMDSDPTLYGCDVLYARQLMKHGFSLWCSPTERPDLGGKEADDNRSVVLFILHLILESSIFPYMSSLI